MNAYRALAGNMRRWHVPATSGGNAQLPAGFRPLLLRLPAQSIELELRQSEVLVGRHTLVDLCLPYPDISRKHCRIVFANERWHVVDVGSLNGIQVNGERKTQADLHDGDVLGIAGLQFEVHEAGESHGTTSGPALDVDPILRNIASTLAGRSQEPMVDARKAS